MTRVRIGLLVLALSTAGLVGAQQDAAAVATQISKARQENAQRTRDYSWTQRTEVKVKGETKNLTTEIVRYTPDGELQKTPISEDKAKSPRGVRGKVAQKKAGEMKDWMAELGELLYAYSLPTAGSLLDFLDKASATPDGSGYRLVATDLIKAGDRMTLWVDEDSGLTKTEVQTQHDGSDVSLTPDQAQTPDDLNYVARTSIVVPDKNVEMTVENFSYKLER
jgi:hypothetical protein